ncbi:MAG: glycosyltransferase [Deltaproteobacteria bacterium]|nr:glycosyltransferase [Deltaproteobacteria bacterium]
MAIVFAAGGTGGHLIPAITVAREISDKVFFFISSKEIDKKILANTPYDFLALPLEPGSGVLSWLRSILLATKILTELKPRVVVGFGGFVSVVPVLVAKLLCIRTLIFEAELSLGKANRFLSIFVDRILVVNENVSKLSKAIPVGYPVRSEFFKELKRDNLEFTVFVMGGSQGSSFFDATVSKILANCEKVKIIYHQCRRDNLEHVKETYAKTDKKFVVSEFFVAPWEVMLKSDVIISRAGAGSIYEIFASQKKFVLVPFPFAASNHQKKNAEWLVKKTNKGIIIEENDPEFEKKLLDFIENSIIGINSSENLEVETTEFLQVLKSSAKVTADIICQEKTF